MLKFRRATFCFYILKFDKSFYHWLILLSGSKRVKGLLGIDSSNREWVANWITDMFAKKTDFETILHILSGDEFYERNKSDISKLQRETGKNIIEIWDTDPIFQKYPHLRQFGRNKEFEKMWAKMKQNQK